MVLVAPLIWVFGEIVPKSVFQQRADTITPYVIYVLRFFSIVFWPILIIFVTLSKFLSRIAGSSAEHNPFTLREQIQSMVQMPPQEGGDIQATEKTMIRRMFNFSETAVSKVMVPLIDITAVDRKCTVGEAVRLAVESSHVRLPVFDGRIDRVVGVLNTMDLLGVNGSSPIAPFISPTRYVPSSKSAESMLVELRKDGDAMAVVMDEFGGAEGIVTIEDIIEEVVEDIQDEYDRQEKPAGWLKKLGHHDYLVSARADPAMDGTWNDPVARTNVYRLFQMLPGDEWQVDEDGPIRSHLAKRGEELAAFYLESIGNGGRTQGLLGGTQGIGLHDCMIDAYLLVSQVYKRGDKIWLFGFSRGAWAARSLGAFIGRSGLIPAANADDDDAADQAERVWLNYKEGRGMKRGGRFWRHNDETPIRMIGVWDTVGELGVPEFNGLHVVDRDELRYLKFTDRELSPRVEHGRQALAIDEERADFPPTLWDERAGVKQVWFPGAHGDVGGGYEDHGLADVALEWTGRLSARRRSRTSRSAPTSTWTTSRVPRSSCSRSGKHCHSASCRWTARRASRPMPTNGGTPRASRSTSANGIASRPAATWIDKEIPAGADGYQPRRGYVTSPRVAGASGRTPWFSLVAAIHPQARPRGEQPRLGEPTQRAHRKHDQRGRAHRRRELPGGDAEWLRNRDRRTGFPVLLRQRLVVFLRQQQWLPFRRSHPPPLVGERRPESQRRRLNRSPAAWT